MVLLKVIFRCKHLSDFKHMICIDNFTFLPIVCFFLNSLIHRLTANKIDSCRNIAATIFSDRIDTDDVFTAINRRISY